MATRGRKPSLPKLQKQHAELQAKIKKLKREERQRKADDEKQRFVILGRALAKELADNEELARKLEPALNARVTKAGERKFLGLPPLAKPVKPKEIEAGQ